MKPSYRAFTVAALADLNGGRRTTSGGSACASFRQQQRLLRVHLRHALLVGAAAAAAAGGGSSHKEEDEGSAAWMDRIRCSVAADILKRTTKSTHQQSPAQRAKRSDPELGCIDLDLSSTSLFIPLQEHAHVSSVGLATEFSPQQALVQISSDLEIPDYTFELLVELLSVRDLAIQSSASTRVGIGAELVLERETQEQMVVLSAPLIPLATSAVDDMVHWDDAVLRFGFDPPSLSGNTSTVSNTKLGHDPQSVINDWVLSIQILKVADLHSNDGQHNHTTTVLGKIHVPLVLLETPLAHEYAMARWFPLERAAVGVPTRGDVRVSISFSMIDVSSQDNMKTPRMVAYKPKISNSGDCSGEKKPNPVSKKRPIKTVKTSQQLRRGSRKPPLSSPTSPLKGSQSAGSNASTQRGARDSQEIQSIGSSASPVRQPNATRDLRRRFSQPRPVHPISPGHRRPKVEAFSPPSSPSSFSSENNMDDVRSPRSPGSPAQQPRRRSSLSNALRAKKQRPVEPANAEDMLAATQATSPAQPFLKRKPYKVVFRKLDWSSVGARTDSSWDAKQPPSGSSSDTTTGPQSSITVTACLSKKQGKQLPASSDSQSHSVGTTINKKQSMSMDPVMDLRLQTLSSAVYECCHVNQPTASLANIKLQAERIAFLQQFQSKDTAASEAPTEEDKLSDHNSSFLMSADALSGLWKALLKDSSGEFYAMRLQHLLSESDSAQRSAPL